MKQITVTINIENAAFEENLCYHEVTRVFNLIANEARFKQLVNRKLYDNNGNHIGEVKIK